MTRFISSLAGAAFAALIPTGACATSAIRLDGPNRALVGYYDLDLQSAKGRKVLGNRIRAAANMVCADRSELMPLVDDQCYRKALASGTSQMNGLIRL
ncbi:MAG: UrcA family protein [Sphingomonadaceae bacterium]|nr:UrcA family protein [Sphingomonas sp.]MBV9881803.1 UrcA family protein [Sphingomonadaceae bacterium]